MTEVISVRFRGGCKNYYFDPKGHAVKMGDQVIVETAQGPEFGTCTQGNHEVADEAVVQPLCAMLRLATDADRRTVDYNRKKESEAFDICEKKIADHGLEMKLVNVSASFDGSKIIFFFTADGRVDFRELVRDLAGVFRARIELRQIGVRDEAKMVGGLGICGRPFCCSQFLDGFLPVSIKMAKTQNLSLNPTKISGTCGRLMCCLKYEQNAYEDLIRSTPRVGTPVSTPEGNGVVCEISNLITGALKVKIESGEGFVFKNFSKHEVTSLRGEARPSGESGQDGEQPRPPKPDRGERREAPRQRQDAKPAEDDAQQSRPPRPRKPRSEKPAEPAAPRGEGDAPAAPPAGEKAEGAKPRPRRRRGGRGRSGGAKPAEAAAPAPVSPQGEE